MRVNFRIVNYRLRASPQRAGLHQKLRSIKGRQVSATRGELRRGLRGRMINYFLQLAFKFLRNREQGISVRKYVIRAVNSFVLEQDERLNNLFDRR